MAKQRLLWLSLTFRVAVAIVAIGLALGTFRILVMTKPQPARSVGNAVARPVEVMAARPVPVARQWIGYGTAQAKRSSDVPARVTAIVLELGVGIDAGRWVEEGQLLVRLDDTDFREQEEIAGRAIEDIDAQLEQTQIDVVSWTRRKELATELVQLAEREFDRLRAAEQSGAAKEREVDTAKQGLIASIRDEVGAEQELNRLAPLRLSLEAKKLGLVAERRLAKQNLERCRITSPLDGILQSVDVEVGENLTAGERVARVVALDDIEVVLRLPASSRLSLRTGDPAVVSTTGAHPVRREAVISRIIPEDDLNNRTLGLIVELKQDPRAAEILVPGQFLSGTLSSATPAVRTVVPRRAMEGDRVRLVESGRIVSHPVEVAFEVEAAFPELGLPDDQWVVLRNPLPDEALVVIDASRGLPDGLAVRPIIAGDDLAGRPSEAAP